MRPVVALYLLPLIVLPGLAIAPSRAPSSVAWLSGCWESSNGTWLIEERWSPARGGVMLETGRTTNGDSLVEYEFVVLHLSPSLAYEAHPSGQTPTTFPVQQATDSSLIFENLKHDFPQRVAYQRRGGDSLLAWIEGPAGGQIKRFEFHYHRVSCE